ncbi:MAG: AAA family ATPase [Oscillospiraceae bacterium]|nr:AAA family ATPase [Oscillospiraceae bacterium]
MKQIMLCTLKITNFKGISSYTFNPEGRDATIRGTNATGKTTVFDAFTWLLFGKDSLDRADFGIRPILQSQFGGDEIGDTSVEATLDCSGDPVTLKRTYREKWTRVRGQTEDQFSGYETVCTIDGVPKLVSEYKAYVEGLIPEQIFRSITNTRYFCTLKWQDRRKMLFDMAGEIPADELFAGGLAKLRSAVGRNTVEDYAVILKKEQLRLNKELERLSVRRDEVSLVIDEGAEKSPYAATSGETIDQMRREIASLRSENTTQSLRDKLSQVRRDLEHMDLMEQARVNGERNKMLLLNRGKVQSLRQQREQLSLAKSDIERKIEIARQQRGMYENELNRLRERWRAEEAKKSSYQPESVCPHCGQIIPEDKVSGARAAYIAECANRQTLIVGESKQYAGNIEEIDAQLDLLETAARMHVDYDSQIRSIGELIDKVESIEPTVDPDPTYIKLREGAQGAIILLERSIKTAETGEIGTAALQRIAYLTSEIDKAEIVQSQLRQNAAQRDRIAELNQQRRDAGVAYETNQMLISLCEEYARRKMRLTQERIDKLFHLVNWRLYITQQNGGIADDCTPMVDHVPYSDLNNASRINAGIDCINALCRYHGVTAPVWVDNAEGIVDILPTSGQLIRLVVDSAEGALREDTLATPIEKMEGTAHAA